MPEFKLKSSYNEVDALKKWQEFGKTFKTTLFHNSRNVVRCHSTYVLWVALGYYHIKFNSICKNDWNIAVRVFFNISWLWQPSWIRISTNINQLYTYIQWLFPEIFIEIYVLKL